MKVKWLAIVAILVVALVLGGCANGGVTPGNSPVQVNLASQQEGIWVSGRGEVTVTPDIVNLRLGVEAQAVTISEAQAQAAAAMNGVMEALKNNGVATQDVQTQHFSIQPVTRWDRTKEEPVLIGYRVTNTVNAKIRKLENTGLIIDAVAGAGGDNTRINGISFSVEDPCNYYDAARAEAMADAKAKAEQLAELGGVQLGKPTYISEGTYAPAPIYRQDVMAGAEAAPTTPISPGELDIVLTVQVVFGVL